LPSIQSVWHDECQEFIERVNEEEMDVRCMIELARNNTFLVCCHDEQSYLVGDGNHMWMSYGECRQECEDDSFIRVINYVLVLIALSLQLCVSIVDQDCFAIMPSKQLSVKLILHACPIGS
jgi:hypothetical protein